MTDLTITPALRARRVPRWLVAAVTWLGSLRHLSLLAVLPLTSWAHWELAVMIGTPPWLAWCWPLALDAYVLSALRAWETAPEKRHRDLAWALGLDLVAVPGSHAVMLLRDVTPLWVMALLAAVVGMVQVGVLWRVHALDVEVRRARPAKAAPKPVPVTVEAVPDKPAAKTPKAPVKPRTVAAELTARRDAGMDRAQATAEVAALGLASERTVRRQASTLWAA